MKDLTAQTPIQLIDENGAKQKVLFGDFLLALSTYQHGKITIDYKSYVYDSFRIAGDKEKKGKPEIETPEVNESQPPS